METAERRRAALIRECPSCKTKNRIPPEHMAETGQCGKCKAPLPPISEPVEADPELFDEVARASSVPVLVDFWAEWCVPCKTLVPTIEAVAEQFNGRLKVGKLNVEENAHVPYRYNITTLPTLMIFKRGQVSEQRVGLLSKENLIKLVETHLG